MASLSRCMSRRMTPRRCYRTYLLAIPICLWASKSTRPSRADGCSSPVKRACPSAEGGGGRWPVDHLFLDQDAIPTLVEVKRSSDTRIRREVVGQMLDYAANAVVYWPVDHLYAQFETQCRAR